MKELDHGREIALHGPEAADALTRMQEQLDRWGMVMPSIEPLVLDFGLGQFDKTGLIEHWIADNYFQNTEIPIGGNYQDNQA